MKALFATLTLWTATLAQRQQPSGFRQQPSDFHQQPSSFQQQPQQPSSFQQQPQQPSSYQQQPQQPSSFQQQPQQPSSFQQQPLQQPSSFQQQPEQQPAYDNNYPTTAEPTRNDVNNDRQTFQRSGDYVTPIPIIRLSKQMSLDGTYKSSYETANSIVAEESGFLKPIGGDGKEGIVQYGTYSYTDPEGKLISVKYTADEGGFRAEGEHLPTPPPVPAEVQKGLDIIFESIKQRQLQEAEFRKNGAESANFPPEDDGSYKPSLYT